MSLSKNSSAFEYNVFPSILNIDPKIRDQQLPHAIKFTAYDRKDKSGEDPIYTAFLFLPSGAGSGGAGIVFQDKHEYADIKLANILEKTSVGPGAVAVAGLAGYSLYPNIHVIYRSPELRIFTFAFLLTPSSQTESDTIKLIVKNMRKYAAPKLRFSANLPYVGNSGLYFRAPEEWDINFLFNGEPNKSIPKIKRAALLNISADYTSQGEWSTFKDGSPIACMLTLTFKELELIDKDSIEDGY